MGDYKRLKVWRKAHDLACAICRVTRSFPRTDQFVLADQIQRAAISIGANVAEGCRRNGDREFRRFLNIALGPANELQYLLELALDVEVFPSADGQRLIAATDEVRRMLASLCIAIEQGRRLGKEKGAAEAAPIQSPDS